MTIRTTPCGPARAGLEIIARRPGSAGRKPIQILGERETKTIRSILFVHQNFPGQFGSLAQALASSGRWRVMALGGPDARALKGVDLVRWAAPRRGTIPGVTGRLALDVARAEAAAAACRTLASSGLAPDVVFGHPGWGETLLLRSVFPRTVFISYLEYFFSPTGGDVGFDPELGGEQPGDAARLLLRNATSLYAAAESDVLVTPTAWQASRFPPDIARRLVVAHEGIDTAESRPDPDIRVELPDGSTARHGDEIITFVSRNLEPYRGFHTFMRALPAVLAARPKARILVVGGEGTSYGPAPPPGRTWRDIYVDEVRGRLDLSRVHVLGRVPHDVLTALFQVTAVHCYLTCPFVLSWSMLEAMACGALVVGSRTPPVEEVIRDSHNGVLVDFFDVAGLSQALTDALAQPGRFAGLRQAARQTIVERYDRDRVCLPRLVDLVETAARRS